MSDLFYIRSFKEKRSGSHSPTKFSQQNLTNASTSIESPQKYQKFLEKRDSLKLFPYRIKEVSIPTIKPVRSLSTRKLSQLTPVLNSLPKKSPSKIRLNKTKRASNNQFVNPFQQNKFELNYKGETVTEEKGVFQLEILAQPVLETYTELSEQSKSNLKKIARNSLNLFLDVQNNFEKLNLNERKSNYLTEQDLKLIMDQYDMPSNARDYLKIDEILRKLDFFLKFPSSVRMQIYCFCLIIHVLPGQYIFKQGDLGDSVYVVVKGSVIFEKTLKELTSYELIVNSIYDGKHFGDLSLLSHLLKQPNKLRQASCMSSEDSYFFQIPKDIYAEILFNTQQKEIEEKVRFFENCKLFQSINIGSISSLATIVPLFTYQIDEIIIRQGEIPKGLYIIYSGNAVLNTQGYREQGLLSKYANKRKIKKAKPAKQRIKQSIIQRALFNNLGPLTPRTLETVKDFIQDHSKIGQSETPIVKENLDFASLYSQDYFGGRVLLQANDQDKSLASKFTITVKSATLKVFIIDKFNLQNFSDELIQQMRTILSKCYEIDCPPEINPAEMTTNLKSWLAYKKEFTEQLNKESFVRRNRSEYPFIRN